MSFPPLSFSRGVTTAGGSFFDREGVNSVSCPRCGGPMYSRAIFTRHFHHAYVLLKGGMDKESVAKTVDFIAEKCVPPFPLSEARRKVESAFERFSRRAEEGARNISEFVREFVNGTTGHFSGTDVAQNGTIGTKEGKHAVKMALLPKLNVLIEKRFVGKDEEFEAPVSDALRHLVESGRISCVDPKDWERLAKHRDPKIAPQDRDEIDHLMRLGLL